MTTRLASSIRPGLHRQTLVLLAGLALGLAAGGCDQDDTASATIHDATIKLAGLAPGAVPTPGDSALHAEYGAVISALQPIATGGGGAGQQAAANVLISRATYGQALAPLAEASALQVDIVNGATAARATLKAYLSQSAHALGVAGLDPAGDLRSIETKAAEVQAELAQATKKRADLDAQIASLLSQAKQKADAAAVERARDGELRQQMSSSSQVQGLALMEEAAKHRRAADALDAEGADLEARAAQLAPEAALAGLRVESLTGQQKGLAEARESVRARDAIAKERSAAAGAAAGEAREALAQAIDAVHGSLHGTGQFTERVQEAIDGFSKAAAAAQKARQGGSAGAGAALAEARQAEGDAHWMNAQSLEVYASLLEAAAAAQPALPDASSLASRAAEARAQQKAALEAATTAYQEARDTYGGGEGGAAALDARLIQIIKATSGGTVDLSAQLQETGEAPPVEPTEVAATDGPQAAIQAILDASKASDYSALGDLIYISDESQRPLFDAIFGMAEKLERLDAACVAKFGAKVSEQLGQMGGGQLASPGMGMLDQEALESLSAADFQVTVNGDTATAVAPIPDADPLNLRKVDGRWLLDPGMGEDVAAVGAMMPMIQAMGTAMEGLTRRVEAGEFQSIQQVTQALMMAVMGGGVPPPGGG